MNSKSKGTSTAAESKWQLIEARVMMSDNTITTGGIIWVRGGELVKPFWLILVYKGGVMVIL